MLQHPNFRWLPALVAAVVLAVAVPVAAQSDGNPISADGESTESNAGVDTELFEVLETLDLMDEWTSVGVHDPRSTLVTVVDRELEGSREELIARARELAEVRPRGQWLESMLVQLDEIEAQLVAERHHLETESAVITLSLGIIDDALADAAVAQYVRGSNLPPVGDDLEAVYTDATHSALIDVAVEDLLTRHRDLADQLADRRDGIDDVDAAKTQTMSTRRDARAELEEISPRWDELEEIVPEMLVELRDERLGGTVVGLDLTLVTFDAYLTAEAVLAERRPECGIRWQVFAAVGRIESNHGRDQGARVRGDGSLSSPFLGPLLDGTLEGVQVVTDTDGGAIDGNASFDRAVGPFQFLPGSWRATGFDANDDGVIDIQNMYDSAAAAGEYLCVRVSPLTTDDALRQAFLRYNASGEYADAVVDWVRTYDEFVIEGAE